MNEHAKQSLLRLKQDMLYCFCLILTLTFFIYKGITYSLIGSFVPLLLITCVLGLIWYSLSKSPRTVVKSIGLWSALIILWSFIRILLSAVNQFVKPVPEGHVDAQLGLVGSGISLAFLFMGIYLWRNRKKLLLTS